MSSTRGSRTSRSLSPPRPKNGPGAPRHACERCNNKAAASEDKKSPPNMSDKSQQTKANLEKTQEHQQCRYAGNVRRPSSRQSITQPDSSSRNTRQANIVCTKHEKEKVKMQTTIEKLQEAFCDKESKLQDTKSQLVRERRMSEIMERQLKNARNLSEQLGRIIHDREQEIRTLKNLLNKRQDTKNLSEASVQAAVIKASRKRGSREEFQGSMRRSSSTSDHTDCPSLSSTSVDKMLKEVHSLIDGLKIKDEAIKGLQEECTRRLDKIQILQRSVQVLQDQLTQSSQHHTSVAVEKDNVISQLQHTLKESEETVQSLLSEKTKVVIEGENTIQELQEIIQQKDLLIKRVQGQLGEALETKETELLQLREALEVPQRDLEAKQRDLESAHEELFRSQMESEGLKMELNQEKGSLNKMSEEINSLVDKLTMAVGEMETTKLEYHKKDERLKHTQNKIQDLYMSFFGDKGLTEKLYLLCNTKRQCTGRKVLSEENIAEKISHHTRHHHLRNESKTKNSSFVLSSTQIHKQQLSELQQQVTDSQAVCGILQEQLKEVTDFLDQLLHIEISPPALSLIRHYGRHLKAPANLMYMSKERIAPDGVSSNSQLDIESSRQRTLFEDFEKPDYRNHGQLSEGDTTITKNYNSDTQRGYQDFDYYSHPQHRLLQPTRDFYPVHQRSLSAEDLKESYLNNTVSTDNAVQVSVQGASTDSDEILLLLDDVPDNQTSRGMTRQAVVSPPFPRGLKITENYGSDGSINTKENTSSNLIERSVSFGSFSDSVLMSYEQSEERGASGESSGLVNHRCVRSIDMIDLIPVGDNGQDLPPQQRGICLSSDSDIWSEPDTTLSRQRMGLRVEETTLSSDYATTHESEELPLRRTCSQSRGSHRRAKAVVHVPTKKTANKVRRWLERLKSYLRMFEETNFHLTDELNNICDVKSQMTVFIATANEETAENCEAILLDLAEYIRVNFLLQKKLEKSIHFNRQLIDVFQQNIACPKAANCESNEQMKSPSMRNNAKRKRAHHHHTSRDEPVVCVPTEDTVVYEEAKSSDIPSQLVGYHSTLMSCQDMIKDLHAQLKDRHCNEIINKHELNRTVYGYLEDIDHCIDDLCKKMESNTADGEPAAYGSSSFALVQQQKDIFKAAFGALTASVGQKESVAKQEDLYQEQETAVIFQNPLMDKLKQNEERLLRFEVLLSDKEQQLKLSAENAMQLESQLSGIKRSLYEIQVENLELKECLELSENKQLEMEDSSNQMLRELQLTMQRLADLEERFRCLNDEQFTQQKEPSVPYGFQNGDTWEEEEVNDDSATIPPNESDDSTYPQGWESERY